MSVLRIFKKICKNLNSYELTDEYKRGKKIIERELKVNQILKEKKVDLGAIYYLMSIEPPIKNSILERYNQLIYLGKETRKVQLTEEEMQLIVDWLKR